MKKLKRSATAITTMRLPSDLKAQLEETAVANNWPSVTQLTIKLLRDSLKARKSIKFGE